MSADQGIKVHCMLFKFKSNVNLKYAYKLNSGIGLELQGTHRSLRILVIASFHYSDIKTLTSSTSKRLRLHQLHTF